MSIQMLPNNQGNLAMGVAQRDAPAECGLVVECDPPDGSYVARCRSEECPKRSVPG